MMDVSIVKWGGTAQLIVPQLQHEIVVLIMVSTCKKTREQLNPQSWLDRFPLDAVTDYTFLWSRKKPQRRARAQDLAHSFTDVFGGAGLYLVKGQLWHQLSVSASPIYIP